GEGLENLGRETVTAPSPLPAPHRHNDRRNSVDNSSSAAWQNASRSVMEWAWNKWREIQRVCVCVCVPLATTTDVPLGDHVAQSEASLLRETNYPPREARERCISGERRKPLSR